MTKILSEITYIDKKELLSTDYIEQNLRAKYGELIRWAIVDTQVDKLKICLTYEKSGS